MNHPACESCGRQFDAWALSLLRRGGVGLRAGLVRALVLMLMLAADGVVRAGENAGLDGYWQSDGYGLFAEVAGDAMNVFEITDISCIKQRQIRFQPAGENRWQVPDDRDPDDDALALRLAAGPPERLYLHRAGTASQIIFTRADARPAVCGQQLPNDALHNFDVFWQTFAEHYPFFKLKGIDWQAMRDRYRPMLGDQTTDRQLFDTLAAMIEPLEDIHVRLVRTGTDDAFMGVRRDAYDTDSNEAFMARAQQAAGIVDEKYLRGPTKSYARDNVLFGWLPGEVGYLRITSFSGFGEGSFQNQLRQLERDLDAIFAAEMKALVIDLRLNLGGSDVFGQSIAARLATEPYVAYRKVARNDRKDAAAWTDPQPSNIAPRRPGFTGPVVVLISRGTISAGETFTQALLGRKPRIVLIGRSTQGVFSDVLNRTLPNGWTFGLPNEIFLDEEGHYYDGVGIAPDHRVEVFARPDLEAGRDPAVEKALEVLGVKAR